MVSFTQGSLFLLCVVQALSAGWNIIHDCDETFNYWEPTHYLIFGNGLQTWEYSPEYGLRSYLYIGLHALLGGLVAFPLRLLGLAVYSKVAVFYFIRLMLGLATAVGQTVFLRGVYTKFGPSTARLALIFLLLAPGVFFSSTAYLPSSFCMMAYYFAFGHYFRGNHFSAVIFGSLGVLVGWPFPLVMLLPMALDLVRLHGALRVLLWGAISSLLWLAPSLCIDYAFYRKLVVAVLNIFLYNATSNSEDGSQLYGVEPFSFYFVNGFLNFNVVWLLALAGPLFVFVFRDWHPDARLALKTRWSVLALAFPMYAWLALMLYLPHKEERFLYVIYPLVVLHAALFLTTLLHVSAVFLNSLVGRSSRSPELERPQVKSFIKTVQVLLIVAVIVVFAAFSFARIVAVTNYYNAPLRIYDHFHQQQLQQQHEQQPLLANASSINVCFGKEWYRFPSNFFLPSPYQLQFIPSGFKGQLPQPFTTPDAVQPNFNDRNREEPSRYVAVRDCDYIVDVDLPEQSEPHYLADTQHWKVVASLPFLDASRSHSIFRAFYVPFLADKHLVFNPYVLLQRIAPDRD